MLEEQSTKLESVDFKKAASGANRSGKLIWVNFIIIIIPKTYYYLTQKTKLCNQGHTLLWPR